MCVFVTPCVVFVHYGVGWIWMVRRIRMWIQIPQEAVFSYVLCSCLVKCLFCLFIGFNFW